jgi:hypothetical protein
LVDEPLTLKDGGRPDQLSFQYRQGIDKFRIYSIKKILDAGVLDEKQRQLAVEELDKKCKIYGQGCIKHGKSEEGAFYLKMTSRLNKLAHSAIPEFRDYPLCQH